MNNSNLSSFELPTVIVPEHLLMNTSLTITELIIIFLIFLVLLFIAIRVMPLVLLNKKISATINNSGIHEAAYYFTASSAYIYCIKHNLINPEHYDLINNLKYSTNNHISIKEFKHFVFICLLKYCFYVKKND